MRIRPYFTRVVLIILITMLKHCILSILLIHKFVHTGVLLWAPNHIEVSSLKHFNDDDMLNLISDLGHPKILGFKSDSCPKAFNTTDIFNNSHTAYIPNADINLKNVKELNGCNEKTLQYVEESFNNNKFENTLIVIIFPNRKVKRDVEIPSIDRSVSEVRQDPVLYNAEGKAMIYSSRPPLLNTNLTSLSLEKSAVVTLDTRDTYCKLSAAIPVDDGKIILRFKFPVSNGYWYLTSVEVVDTESKTFNLNITKVVGASSHFSYHCFGQTVFRDAINDIELILYEIQAQPDARNGKFSDALDCVTFTTVPIWSGLFVVFTLIVGLFIGLGALGSIKTMDKFDNYKTKQLSITLAE